MPREPIRDAAAASLVYVMPVRILLINQFYWPDYAATAQMLADLAESLAAAGHDVRVLCSRGKYDDGTGTPLGQDRRQTRRGVTIRRVAATGLGKSSMFRRIVDYASVHLLIGLRTLWEGWRYDVIVTLTAPPLIGLYATPLRLLTGTRHVCWVMDLHPDCEFELGMLDRRRFLPRLLDALNGLHFRRADHNVVLGDDMGDRLAAKGVARSRITTIPVWGHELAESEPRDSAAACLRAELEGRFVVMYAGNAGLLHTFDEVCAAALSLRDDDRFVFLFVGGGRRIGEVEAFQKQYQLNNIVLHGYVPRDELGATLSLGDVHLITLRDGMAGVAAPSKLYGVMSVGRPVIFIGPRECATAVAIDRAGCGVNLPTGKPEDLVEQIHRLAADRGLVDRLGKASRAAYERDYNAAVCCERWRELLEAVVAGATTAPSSAHGKID